MHSEASNNFGESLAEVKELDIAKNAIAMEQEQEQLFLEVSLSRL